MPSRMTNDRTDGLRRIDAWQKRVGMNDYRLSLHACANPTAMKRIRNGGGQIITFEQVLDYVEKFPQGPLKPSDEDGRRTYVAKSKK